METLTIQYTSSKYEKFIAISCGSFLFAICLYILVNEALLKNYNFLFFIAIAGAILALATFFTFSWWQPQPLISINNQQIHVNLPKMRNQTIEWNTIKNIAIGGGHIKITTDKELFLDLGTIKQTDINRIKSKIVEICDTKNIAFQND